MQQSPFKQQFRVQFYGAISLHISPDSLHQVGLANKSTICRRAVYAFHCFIFFQGLFRLAQDFFIIEFGLIIIRRFIIIRIQDLFLLSCEIHKESNKPFYFKPYESRPILGLLSLGLATKDDRFDWYRGEPLPVAALGGKLCQILLDDYDDDPAKEDFHAAVKNFLSFDLSALQEARPYIFQYFMDCNSDWSPEDNDLRPSRTRYNDP